MNNNPLTRFELASLLLFPGALLLLLQLELLAALIGGMLVYALVYVLVPRLRAPAGEWSRLLAVALIATAVIGVITMAGFGIVALVRGSGEDIPALIQRMASIIEGARDQVPSWLIQYMPEDAAELQNALVNWLRTHAAAFQVAGAGLGRALAHILIGMVIGALLSLETAVIGRERGPFTVALAARARRLATAFRRVVFAQVWISAINTLFTAVYLGVLLPLFGINLPFTKTLIGITFIAGLLPILGNLISNTVIFIVSLSQSLLVAFISLAYLIIIHKLEYFLNARIIGGHIRARAWEMLIAMLVMEAAFGIAGLIAAPIYYAYLKDELRERGFI
jgi:predicted PurR-regulated permease PerM